VTHEGAEDEEETRREEAMELERIGSQRRAVRSDRWPSFITRTFSSRVPFWSASRRAAPDAEAAVVAAGMEASTAAARTKREKTATAADGGTVTPPKGSVRFDCLGGGATAVSAARVGAAAGDSETEDDDEEKAIARHA
jgi:E3 ubiquitin-protein ligase ATL6/9/15/31/42/55